MPPVRTHTIARLHPSCQIHRSHPARCLPARCSARWMERWPNEALWCDTNEPCKGHQSCQQIRRASAALGCTSVPGHKACRNSAQVLQETDSGRLCSKEDQTSPRWLHLYLAENLQSFGMSGLLVCRPEPSRNTRDAPLHSERFAQDIQRDQIWPRGFGKDHSSINSSNSSVHLHAIGDSSLDDETQFFWVFLALAALFQEGLKALAHIFQRGR